MSLILRIAVNAVSLWAAASLIDGIDLSDDFVSVVFVAAIFGLVNAFLKPVALLLSLPLLILSLGLFTVVVNAAMLAITDSLSGGLSVDGFGPALLGALVISFVSWALSSFLPGDDSKQNQQQRRPEARR